MAASFLTLSLYTGALAAAASLEEADSLDGLEVVWPSESSTEALSPPSRFLFLSFFALAEARRASMASLMLASSTSSGTSLITSSIVNGPYSSCQHEHRHVRRRSRMPPLKAEGSYTMYWIGPSLGLPASLPIYLHCSFTCRLPIPTSRMALSLRTQPVVRMMTKG